MIQVAGLRTLLSQVGYMTLLCSGLCPIDSSEV